MGHLLVQGSRRRRDGNVMMVLMMLVAAGSVVISAELRFRHDCCAENRQPSHTSQCETLSLACQHVPTATP